MTCYCTLAEARREIKAQSTVDDDIVLERIRQVSARLDGLMAPRARRPYFAPYIEQRAFPVSSRRIDSAYNTFLIGDPLLAFTEVLLGGSDVTTTVEAYPPLTPIVRALRFANCGRSWYEGCAPTSPVFVEITGAWGFHGDYANAWLAYDMLAADITDSAATGKVVDADGVDPFGLSPRFSPGALLRIDDEFLEVTAVVGATNDLTWRRGVNGSLATAHLQDAPVRVWQVEDNVRRVVSRQAALLYARRGAFQIETIDGVGAISYPQDLLMELRAVLQEYQYG